MSWLEYAKLKLEEYAKLQDEISKFNSEHPEIAKLENEADAVNKILQEYCKNNGEFSGSGWKVEASVTESYPIDKMRLWEESHPEIKALKKSTLTAKVKRA